MQNPFHPNRPEPRPPGTLRPACGGCARRREALALALRRLTERFKP